MRELERKKNIGNLLFLCGVFSLILSLWLTISYFKTIDSAKKVKSTIISCTVDHRHRPTDGSQRKGWFIDLEYVDSSGEKILARGMWYSNEVPFKKGDVRSIYYKEIDKKNIVLARTALYMHPIIFFILALLLIILGKLKAKAASLEIKQAKAERIAARKSEKHNKA